ncbi:MAG: hypothetical protein WKF60_02520 [Ilumatobacter sp.]
MWNSQTDGIGDKTSLLDYGDKANGGEIGKIIDDAIAVDTDLIVVDARFWMFDHKRILPAGMAAGIDHEHQVVPVALPEDQVGDALDYSPDGSLAIRDDYRAGLENYFVPWV